MNQDDNAHRRNQSTPQAIPLRDLSGRAEALDEAGPVPTHHRTLSDRGRSLFRPNRSPILGGPHTGRYAPISEDNHTEATSSRTLPALNTNFTGNRGSRFREDEEDALSPIGAGFQEAMGGISGLSHVEPSGPSLVGGQQRQGRLNLPTLRTVSPDDTSSLMDEELDDGTGYFPSEHDTLPLTDRGRLNAELTSPTTPSGQRHDRHMGRFHSIRFLSPNTRIGEDQETDVEAGESGAGRPRSGSRRSTSPSAMEMPLRRAGTVMRKMSMRVVNISSDADVVERSIRRSSPPRSADHDAPPVPPSPIAHTQTNDFASMDGGVRDKSPSVAEEARELPDLPRRPSVREINPLRGKSLGIFPADNMIRIKLMHLLTHPLTEPFILSLIIAQTVLLAIDGSRNVFTHPRSVRWGDDWIDYAQFGLFIVYTIEIIIRTIVSGFIVNPVEYSTINRGIGIRKAVMIKANELFSLQRKDSVKTPSNPLGPQQPSLLRALTAQTFDDTPGTTRQAQEKRLAHRAYLRHSFTRLDFIAVAAYWISFWIAVFGIEYSQHIYVFRMLSCLRILRLLGITGGTSVILRSLKRAMPSLLNVSFLIGFFWLLFAIIGTQSFKASLRRSCVWQDPLGVQSDYTMNQVGSFQFCGGWLAENGTAMPWLQSDGTTYAADEPKGYWCPVYSKCIEVGNPYNDTVSFDNIVQSLELVFVIMTSNTFSDILYYLTDSDYLAAALYFTFGIVIMTFWLVNLLIAVITSSFQIIREESKASAFAAEQRVDGSQGLDSEGSDQEDMPVRKQSTLKRTLDRTKPFWIAVIVYGVVVQCLRSSSMSHGTGQFILVSQIIVTSILDVEIVLRLVADLRHFFEKKTNIVDLLLAVITTVMLLPVVYTSGQAYEWLTIFQILRSYRVVLFLRLTRDLIMIVLGNFSGIINLMVFVFLLTFLASIFGTQLLRGQLPEQDSEGNTLQVTYFTIWNGFLGMYQMLSSENWTSILYDITRFQTSYNGGWIGATFCVLWFILANFIVLNMFIAVIQENFDVSEDEKRLQQVKAFLQQKSYVNAGTGTLALSTIFKVGQVRRQDPLDFGAAATEMLLKDTIVKDFLDDPEDPEPLKRDNSPTSAATPGTRPESKLLGSKAPKFKHHRGTLWNRFNARFFNREPNPFYSSLQLPTAYQDLDPRQMAKEVVLATDRRKIAQREYLKQHPRYNVSLFLFRPNNPIRRVCQRIVGPGRGDDRIQGVAPSVPIWYLFSAFIYVAIVAMVILACITTPLYQKEYFTHHAYTLGNWFVWTDMGFAALFTIEASIKVIADGFFWTPNAYFRSSWGFIDGIVLVTLWVDVFELLYDPGGSSRAVGAFKALRALRLLNVSDSARDTFHAIIIRGGAKVVSAAFVSLSVLIPFAVYGLNLFNGRMMTCNDSNSNIYNLTDCVNEYVTDSSPYAWNVLAPRQAANSYYNFDSFGDSLFILFQIVSQEGWIDVMWSAQSITGVFTQSDDFASQGNAVFFVIFNLLGTVFVLTLFVSVFMRNYTEQTQVAFLTTEQRSWLELRKLLRQISPSKRPSSKVQRQTWKEWCYKRAIQKNGRWQRGITALLVLHLILLCLEWYPDHSIWLYIRDFIFLFLMVCYIANTIVRIIGLSWIRFRRSAWNVYSVVSVSGGFITTIMHLVNYQNEAYNQVHGYFLVSIALLLIPRNNQLDQLFKTAAASLNAVGNLLATWFVLFLVFAIAFTQTFGLTRFGDNESDNVNFRSVPKALILLFRTSVGEGWNQLMYDFSSITPPYCTIGEHYFDGDCGSASWARGLFVMWNILSMYIFVNLFVSLIFESFSYVYQRSSGLSVISREEIRRFKQAWAEFDPNGTGYITKEAFPRLLGELSGVFEMRIYDGDFTVRNLVEACKLKPTRATVLSFDGFEGRAEAPEIDLVKLNNRLAELPVTEIRRRRTRMNTFYEEVLVSADPDRGIEFNALLMILAHYKVINDNKSLRLEEFLRRRARLQRVDEAVRRNVVIGFFDTLYWTRRFRRRIEGRRSARMTAVPQLDFHVPEIVVQDEGSDDDRRNGKKGPRAEVTPMTPTDDMSVDDFFSPGSAVGRSTGSQHREGSPNGQQAHMGSTLRNRSDSMQYSPINSPTRTSFSIGRTLSQAQAQSAGPSHTQPGSQHSPANSNVSANANLSGDWRSRQRSPSPGNLSGDDAGSDGMGGGRSRTASSVSAQDVMDSLDNSAWGESIRRSFTLRRPSSDDRLARGPSGTNRQRRP